MQAIVGLSMAFSIVILVILVVSTLPQIMQIWRLDRLNQAQECFKDDKFMHLNEDEEAVIDYSLLYASVVCILTDFALLAFTLLVHGTKNN